MSKEDGEAYVDSVCMASTAGSVVAEDIGANVKASGSGESAAHEHVMTLKSAGVIGYQRQFNCSETATLLSS